MTDSFTPRCDDAEILWKWRSRASALAPELVQAKLVREIAGGQVAVPLPASAGPHESMSTANFVLIGLEGTAQRHASMQPNMWSPSVAPGKPKADERADLRRLAGMAWWEQNRVALNDEQRAMQFYAYARAPIMVVPRWRMVDGRRVGMPAWDERDPLAAFPAPGTSASDVHPDDCIFAYQRSWGWLLRNYPDEVKYLWVGQDAPSTDAMFDVIEYVDDEQHTMMVIGRDRALLPKDRVLRSVYSGVGKLITDAGTMVEGHYGAHEACVLQRARNRAGVCFAVMPGRWGLDGRSGMMDGVTGMFFRVQRLSALEDEAIDRGVFPEEWLVNPNGEAKVITQADGRAGILGEITQGTIVTRDLNPGYRTSQAIDRLMEHIQMQGHIPAEMLGQNPTGVRTGVRGEALINAFISFNLASGHRVFQEAKARELEIAACIEREYFGTRPRRFFLSWAGAKGPVDYKPKDIFAESTRFVVRYPTVGADRNIQQQADLAKVNNGVMSRETFMERDQDIEDVTNELSRVRSQRISDAVLVAIETQAANPTAPLQLSDFGRVAEIIEEQGVPPYKALLMVQEEVQRRQAAEQPDAAAEQMPGINGAPVPTGPPPLEALLSQIAQPGQVA